MQQNVNERVGTLTRKPTLTYRTYVNEPDRES